MIPPGKDLSPLLGLSKTKLLEDHVILYYKHEFISKQLRLKKYIKINNKQFKVLRANNLYTDE